MGTIENFKTFNNYVFSVFFSRFFRIISLQQRQTVRGRVKHMKSNYCIGYPGFLLFFNTVCCRTKLLCFLLLLSLSNQSFTAQRHGSLICGCISRTVRGTWNFVWQQATLVQGCTSEAQLNMDVNLCRLPDEMKSISKFPVPLAGFIRIRTRRTVLRLCQSNGKTAYKQAKHTFQNCGILRQSNTL